jgi:poly(beta-D-mannuronate) C5 epimerase
VYALVTVMTLATAIVLSVTVGREYRQVASTSEALDRHATGSSYDPISNVLLGLPPDTVRPRSGLSDPGIRAIAVSPTDVTLLAGGIVDARIASPITTLPGLAAAVGNPGWISIDGHGRAVLGAALVVVQGASFTLTRPVTDVVLDSRRGVLLGAEGGSLAIDGVTVSPSLTLADPATRAGDQRQPFVVAAGRSTLTISHSHLSHLGRDWNGSYGVSWTAGSTGSITGSEVDHAYIATYTGAAHDVTIANNWLHDNTLYAVDPHSASTRIVVRDNLAEGNGRHGIILSDHVTDSLVEGNVTRDNHLDGLVVDDASSENRIVGNTSTGNRGDGLVLASSPGNVIEDNTISDNRVGVEIRGAGGTAGATLTGNHITGNEVAAQGVSLAGNTVIGNGDRWRPRVLTTVWSLAPFVCTLLIGLTCFQRARRGHAGRHRRGGLNPQVVGVDA